MSSNRFYGIYIQKDGEANERNRKDEIHVYASQEDVKKVIKEFGNARFKSFPTEKEAAFFAIHGSESGPGNPSVLVESCSYRSLKREDFQNFRHCIEIDDLTSVETKVWENPRYLIGNGDIPTMMRDGPRYNALHIAAIQNSYKSANFILKTISNQAFTRLMYGADGDHSYEPYVVRPEVLLDRYLNTPDKGLNETPLHFAVKHGSLEVVRIFVQYPQLQLNAKNRYDQTPKDMICKRFRPRSPSKSSGAVIALYTNEIRKLLDDSFYVPIWRSDEDVMQPIIGKPFSPKSPPVYPLPLSPLSPTMEIKAVAGPMSYEEASSFQKTWKSPKSSTPHVSKGVLLRSPLCCDKSLEKAGRTLAKKYHVSWKEYWPFLKEFVDLSSEEGLELLEKHLRNVIDTTTFEAEKNSFIMNTPLSDLCNAFSEFSIVSPEARSLNSSRNDVDSPSVTSPYLCMDNLCSTFAKNLIAEFERNFQRNEPADNNLPILVKKIRNLSGTINSCVIDKSFNSFPFEKIHARVAYWIRSNLSPFNMQMLRYVASIFQLVHDIGKYGDLSYHFKMSPSSNITLNGISDTLKCINTYVFRLLNVVEITEIGPHCSKEWLAMERCCCFSESKSGPPKRRLFFPSDDICPNKNSHFDTLDTKEKTEVTEFGTNCDNDNYMKFRILGPDLCDSDSEDEFFTPNTSINDSDNDMETPDEGPELFIYDNRGTSMDNAVLEALADVKIDPDHYPSIYRWRHSILLHNKLKRFSWPSPSITRLNSKKLRTYYDF